MSDIGKVNEICFHRIGTYMDIVLRDRDGKEIAFTLTGKYAIQLLNAGLKTNTLFGYDVLKSEKERKESC